MEQHRPFILPPGYMITLQHSPISSDPSVLSGTLVFRNTRVPVQTLLDYLQDGYSIEQFLQQFPSVQPADAERFLHLTQVELATDDHRP